MTTLLQDIEISPLNADGTLIQRIPGIELLSVTEVLYMHQQQASNFAEAGDGTGMRIKMHRVAVNDAANSLAITESSIFAEPVGWDDGLGFCGHPHIKKLALGAAAGRVVVLYNQNDAPSGLSSDRSTFYNIYMKYSEDNGATWSTAAKVIDCITNFPGDNAGIVALGSNGDFVEIPSGANAGRLVVPIWYTSVTASEKGVIISDDQGITWSVTGGYAVTGADSENTLAWCPNGTLVQTVRQDDSTPTERQLAWSTNDGANFVNKGIIPSFKCVNCNASTLQIAPNGESYGNLIWSGPSGAETTSRRRNYRLRVSLDGGLTWPNEVNPFDENMGLGYNSTRLLTYRKLLLAYETFTNNLFNTNSSARLALIDLVIAFPELGLTDSSEEEVPATTTGGWIDSGIPDPQRRKKKPPPVKKKPSLWSRLAQAFLALFR